MERRFLAEGGRVGGECPEGADELVLGVAELLPVRDERRRVRLLLRAEAAEAAARVERTERTAAGLRHRAEAGDASRHHHARDARALALDADAVLRHVRATAGEK